MEKKLKVKEVIGLYNELNVFLEESFSQSKKYHIEMFMDKLSSFVDPAEKIRKTLIEKYGDGGVVNPKLEDGTVNPKLQIFWNEYNVVLEEEIAVDCTCKEIDLELLNSLVSDKRYKMIYLHLIKNN